MKTIIQGLSFIGSFCGIVLTAAALEQNAITIKGSLLWFAISLALMVVAIIINKEEYEE